MTRFIAAFLLLSAIVPAQTSDEVEKRIATLPPAQQAYERFRYWHTMLPRDQQSGPDLDARYRSYLKSRGYSDADIDAQLKMIEAQGARAEVDRWNRILTAEKPMFNIKPNQFLVEIARGRKPGTALDVGMGQGRNAIWLAQQGWDVTGFDPAEKAVALAEETAHKLGVHIKTEIKGTENFDFGENRWDLILLSYVGVRGFENVFERALKPGGVLVVEAMHRDATKGRSIGAGVVFDSGQLPMMFPQLRSVRYEEPVEVSDFGLEKVRLVRYCGVKPD